jgi:uncharacterized membrane protein YfcA
VDLWGIALLAVAGILAGTINTVVGSGSLVTFPALLWLGVPAVPANIANTVGLAVGNLSGAWGYRREISRQWPIAFRLAALSFAGAVAGALLLLYLPASFFEAAVPWLIGLGAGLVLLQPLLSRRKQPSASNPFAHTAVHVGSVATGVYGGYFGAAQGIIIMGLLGMTRPTTMQENNGVKNLLQAVAGIAAAIVFGIVGEFRWLPILVLAISSVLGGLLGARYGRRLGPTTLRMIIVVTSIVAILAVTLTS